MLAKPSLSDEKIVACLREAFGIETRALKFLALGNDTYAGVYCVTDARGENFFLKTKRGVFPDLSLALPRYLYENGITQIIAPLPTHGGELKASIDDYALILYPFIHGENGMRRELSEQQWREYGSIVKQLHNTKPPRDFENEIERETFIPKWDEMRDAVEQKISAHEFQNDIQRTLGALWQEKRSVIERLRVRTLELAGRLQAQTHESVLCHADIHLGNVLVGNDGSLYVVDWDQPILAPRERDFLFIVDSVIAKRVSREQQEIFFQGYGETKINRDALAYYRCDWAMYDICEYAARVLLMPDVTEETQGDALKWFRVQFEPGDMVDLALNGGPV